jgi:hypothetical protein
MHLHVNCSASGYLVNPWIGVAGITDGDHVPIE